MKVPRSHKDAMNDDYSTTTTKNSPMRSEETPSDGEMPRQRSKENSSRSSASPVMLSKLSPRKRRNNSFESGAISKYERTGSSTSSLMVQ